MKIEWSYNEESDEEYFLEVDIPYTENIHDLHNNLPFLPEGIKKCCTNKKFKASFKP